MGELKLSNHARGAFLILSVNLPRQISNRMKISHSKYMDEVIDGAAGWPKKLSVLPPISERILLLLLQLLFLQAKTNMLRPEIYWC